MGLDMYLYRRCKYREGDDEFNKLVEENKDEVKYWRKANQIRNWFVNNTDLNETDNCKHIVLTKETLEKLRDDCRYVLAHKDKASEIMPTSSGFFFGTTDYDDWYFMQLEDTAKSIDLIINITNFDKEVIEYFEWW